MTCKMVLTRSWRGPKELEALFRDGEVVAARGGLTVGEHEVVADETGRAVEEFMRYADFISIGTNDLIQYVMATDRGNERVAHLYQPLNPAVIRLIHQVITSAKRNNTWVGVCGEMASYPHTALLLIGMGVDELSTSPSAIPEIKKIIRSISYKHARKVAEKVLSLQSVGRIKNYLLHEVEEIDKSIKDLFGE